VVALAPSGSHPINRERVKILLIIDHFGTGGAQRQLVELACGLKRRGHAVHVFVYFPEHGFFRPRLDADCIPVHEYRKGKGFSFGVIRELVSLFSTGDFDVVISFLNSPNIYAELATLVARRARLVVSERTSRLDDKSLVSALLRRALHRVANHVVVNSRTHCEWLNGLWWLKGRVSCIYNGVDVSSFDRRCPVPESGRELRLLAVGRVGPEKNVINLVAALARFQEQFGYAPSVNWVGPRDASRTGRRYCTQAEKLLASLPEVQRRWQWLGVRSDVAELLAEHHALIHPSLYEGLPNVVCEALAAGMPVLASRVCDHPLLVTEGARGFLFDPNDASSIAESMWKLTELSKESWMSYSRNARKYAEENLGVERMVAAYENLCTSLLQTQRASARGHAEG